MTAKPIMRDERTVTIENASYRWAYLFLSFGLLVSTAYRSFVLHETSWDLLGLVIAGGVIASVYQGGKGVLSRRWAMMTIASAALAALVALGIWLFRP